MFKQLFRATFSVALSISAWNVSSSFAHAELLNGLIAYYDFQSDLNNKAPDYGSLNFYHATDVGKVNPGDPATVTPGWTGVGSSTRSTLLAGNALNIVDGESSSANFIRVALGNGTLAPPSGNLASSFSISAWHYLAPVAIGAGERFYVFEPTAGFDISWGTQDSAPNNYLAYNSQAAGASATLAQNAWQHVVHTFTLSGPNVLMDVYVNGAQVGTQLSQLATSMDFAGINFGNARNGQNRVWDGMLDEIAIWDRPLDAAEVGTVYATGRAGQSLLNPVPEPSTWALGGMLLAGYAVIARRRGMKP